MGKGWLHQKNAVTRTFFVARAKAGRKKGLRLLHRKSFCISQIINYRSAFLTKAATVAAFAVILFFVKHPYVVYDKFISRFCRGFCFVGRLKGISSVTGYLGGNKNKLRNMRNRTGNMPIKLSVDIV